MLVNQALQAFEQGDLEQALKRFEQALQDPATPSPEQALLAINAGVCLMGLGRPGEAESLFERAARLDPALQRVARLQAGLAAAAAGRVERARQVLSAVQPAGEEEQQLAQQLEQTLKRSAEQAQQRKQQAALAKAYTLLDTAPEEARTACGQALALSKSAIQSAEAHYCLSLSLRELGRSQEALAASEQAIAGAPQRSAFHFLHGLLQAEIGHFARAERDFAQALSLNPSAADRARIERTRVALHPLGASGWSGSAEVAMGFDSNAAQSGSAERRGLASTGVADETASQTQSPLLRARGLVEGRWRRSDRWVLLAELGGDLATLTASEVSALGLFTAQAQVGAGLLLMPHLQLELRGGGEHLRQGPDAATPLLTEWGGELTARMRLAPAELLLGLLHRVVEGHGVQASALSGSRSRAWVSANWEPAGWALAGSGGWTASRAGRLQLNADLARVPACSGPAQALAAGCPSAQFDVPLSFQALDLGLQASTALSKQWSALGSAAISRRWYSDPSRLTLGPTASVVDQSEVSRQDWTYDLALELRFALPWSGNQALWLGHHSRVNRSNLRPDLNDPVRRFHYEDRNFNQHRTSFGYRFDW